MSRVLRHLTGLLALPLLAAACTASSEPPPDRNDLEPPPWTTETEFTLEVGGGGWAGFEPHEEGAPIELERGFQGGQHIAYSLRARGVADAPVHAEVTAWLADAESDETLVEVQSIGLLLEDPDPSMYEEVPQGVTEALSILYFVADPDAVLGREGELRVQVTLEDDRVGRAFMAGTVRWLGEADDEPAPDAGP